MTWFRGSRRRIRQPMPMIVDPAPSEMSVYHRGCSAMQVKIAAWLTFQGYGDLAARILEMGPPSYQQPDGKVGG